MKSEIDQQVTLRLLYTLKVIGLLVINVPGAVCSVNNLALVLNSRGNIIIWFLANCTVGLGESLSVYPQ